MTSFEWLAVAYFTAVAAAGGLAAGPSREGQPTASDGAPRRKRGRAGLLYAAAAILLVIVAGFALPWGMRAWLPHAYLVLGYWIPAAFAAGPNERFERWLTRTDAWLNSQLPIPSSQFPTPNSQASGSGAYGRIGDSRLGVGRWELGVEVLELAYLLCYLVVPVAFAAVYAYAGSADVERFWLAVLLTGFICYGSLPWTAARPPRLAPGPARNGLARVNAAMLGRLSHQLVTFPSGHAAVPLAAALSIGNVAPELAWGIGLVAVAIAVAAVAGRYHYLVDVLLGMLVGAMVPVLTGSVA